MGTYPMMRSQYAVSVVDGVGIGVDVVCAEDSQKRLPRATRVVAGGLMARSFGVDGCEDVRWRGTRRKRWVCQDVDDLIYRVDMR